LISRSLAGFPFHPLSYTLRAPPAYSRFTLPLSASERLHERVSHGSGPRNRPSIQRFSIVCRECLSRNSVPVNYGGSLPTAPARVGPEAESYLSGRNQWDAALGEFMLDVTKSSRLDGSTPKHQDLGCEHVHRLPVLVQHCVSHGCDALVRLRARRSDFEDLAFHP